MGVPLPAVSEHPAAMAPLEGCCAREVAGLGKRVLGSIVRVLLRIGRLGVPAAGLAGRRRGRLLTLVDGRAADRARGLFLLLDPSSDAGLTEGVATREHQGLALHLGLAIGSEARFRVVFGMVG